MLHEYGNALAQKPDASDEDKKNAQILKKWSHEEQSRKMLEHLLDANNIDLSLEEYGALDKTDITFIYELINGEPLDGPEEKGCTFKGRGADKIFLYEIVSNKQTGLDTDRLDYLQRDVQAALGQVSKVFERLTESCAVCKDPNGRFVLAYPEEEVQAVMEIYATRMNMYSGVYMHRKTLIMVFSSCVVIIAVQTCTVDMNSACAKVTLTYMCICLVVVCLCVDVLWCGAGSGRNGFGHSQKGKRYHLYSGKGC